MGRFSRIRAALDTDLEEVNEQNIEHVAAEMTVFGLPLLARALLIAFIGVVPLLAVRAGTLVDETVIPMIAAFTLAATGAAVITWLAAIIITGIVTMMLKERSPVAASHLVAHTIDRSFTRVSDASAQLMMVALVGGLVAVAAGLPSEHEKLSSGSVIQELLAAQVAVLVGFLAIGFIAEAFRSVAHVVDKKEFPLAWPWALVVVAVTWFLTTSFGPFEFTDMVRRLLTAWLPASVEGIDRNQIINDLMPRGARWWASLGGLIPIGAIWAVQAKRFDRLSPPSTADE